MKKRLLLAFVLLLGLLVAACSSNDEAPSTDDGDSATTEESSGDTIELKIGHIAPPEHSYTKGIEIFAEKVEERTDGRVTFEIFGDGQLGGEREIIEQVQLGSLDLTVATAGVVGSFVPELSVLEMPFLFNDVEEAYEVLDGEIGEELMAKIEEQGFKALGMWENGMRHIVNNKQPVHTPEDMASLKMRTVENDLYIETYRALGTDATPIAFPEAYTSLEQGVVDGQDLSIGVMVTTKMYEVQNHLTENGIYYAAAPIFMNADKFAELPEDIQEVIVEVAKEVTDEQRQINQDMETEQKEFLKEEGVEIVEPSAEEMAAFQEAVQPVYDKLSDQFDGLVEQIQEQLGK